MCRDPTDSASRSRLLIRPELLRDAGVKVTPQIRLFSAIISLQFSIVAALAAAGAV